MGVEKYSLNRFEGSLTTTPSSVMHVSSEMSCPEDGNSGFNRFQNPPGVVALAAEAIQKRLIEIRLSLVTSC